MNIPVIIEKGASWFASIGTPGKHGHQGLLGEWRCCKPGVYELVMGSRLVRPSRPGRRRRRQDGPDRRRHRWRRSRLHGGDPPFLRDGLGLRCHHGLQHHPRRHRLCLSHHGVPQRGVMRGVHSLPGRHRGDGGDLRDGSSKAKARQEDIKALEDLSKIMMSSSLCGLGQAAPVPVLDTLKYFRNDYENRIKQSVFLRTLR